MSDFLILDTTADISYAVTSLAGVTRFFVAEGGKGKTSERVIPLVERALAESGADPRSLDCVFAVTGPGSFTGIRIGVSTALALGRGWNLPVAGLTVFDGLGNTLAAIPSRQGWFYYRLGDSMGEVSAQELQTMGSARTRYSDFGENVSNEEYARNLVAKAQSDLECGELKEAAPLYLKKSQAERLKDGK